MVLSDNKAAVINVLLSFQVACCLQSITLIVYNSLGLSRFEILIMKSNSTFPYNHKENWRCHFTKFSAHFQGFRKVKFHSEYCRVKISERSISLWGFLDDLKAYNFIQITLPLVYFKWHTLFIYVVPSRFSVITGCHAFIFSWQHLMFFSISNVCILWVEVDFYRTVSQLHFDCIIALLNGIYLKF